MNILYGHELLVPAPAKVNVNLLITGKRADGYHSLDSVMQKIDLFDTLRITLSKDPGIHLSCPDSDLPVDRSNIVWRAAEAFLQAVAAADRIGVSIVLEKKIPIAAGLGGGSSDAGAVLTGLNRLIGAGISAAQLIDIARPLGADVPFFVVPHSAVRARGIGDEMVPVPSLVDCALLLVNPGFSVSTAWVYKNFTLTRVVKDSRLFDSQKNDNLSSGRQLLFNDLESVTIRHYPEIAALKSYLLENGASDALMSGSGPTVFALFPAASEEIYRCAEQLKKKYGHGVIVTQVIASSSPA